MKLINPDEIKFVIAPIAPICIGEQVHFENVTFKHDIEQIQRIEAEPVKHAHWEIEKTVCARFARCSRCGIHIRIPTTGHKESERFYLYPDEMHYCPNCGAKMDGKVEGMMK